MPLAPRRLEPRHAAMASIAVGLTVMVVAGLMAAPYSTGLDPDATCRVHGRCDPVANAEAVRRLWWWSISGFVVVTAGLAWLGWTIRAATPTRRMQPNRAVRWPAPRHGAAAGGAGGGILLVATFVLLLSIFVSGSMFAAAFTATWLTQAWALDRVHRAAVPDSRPWSRFAASVVTSAAGLAATALLQGSSSAISSLPVWALADGLIVATLVLAGRLLTMLPVRRRAPEKGPGWGGRDGATFGLLALVTALVGTVMVAIAGFDVMPDRGGTGGAAEELEPTPHDTTPGTVPAAPPVPSAATPPGADPTTPPVLADVACGAGDLSLTTIGWSAAMGLTAVTVVATNTGASACYVEGFADITLSQGGEEVELVLRRSSAPPDATTAPDGRTGVAPGGQARFDVTWEGYRQQADSETPQDLTVTVAGSDVPVELTDGPAPFDVVGGAEVGVGPWLPGGVA